MQYDIDRFRKGIKLYYKLCQIIIMSGNKIGWKLQLIGFSYDQKSAIVVSWKDEEYEYILNA